MADNTSTRGWNEGLKLPVDDIAEEIRAADPNPTDPALQERARALVEEILGGQAGGSDARAAVDDIGLDAQQRARHQSDLLQTPLRRLAQRGEEGGPVAGALLALQGKMRELDPQRHNLEQGGLSGVLARIPGVGNRLQRYFRKFESAQDALDNIVRELEAGKEVLRRDNLTLIDDQVALRETMDLLRDRIALGMAMDRELEKAAQRLERNDERRAYIEEELLFPLRQRIADLQQQRAVSQQGVLALEVLVRNNRELMRGVDRAVNVTVGALNVAVTVALGLADQRLVLDKVEALNRTTSDLIAGTARALRSQGAEIQSRAAGTTLDMERLEQAFEDVFAAVDELSRYRREALPTLQRQIERLGELSKNADAVVQRYEAGQGGRLGESDASSP